MAFSPASSRATTRCLTGLPTGLKQAPTHAAQKTSARVPPTINVADPKVFIGLLMVALCRSVSSLAINAVSRTAGVVVEEVRRQFR